MRSTIVHALEKMKSLQRIPQTIVLGLGLAGPAASDTCFAPERPYVPHNPSAVSEFADLIRRDFEDYIHDIQVYFQCLDVERSRAFEEARDVSQEYGEFVERVEQE